MGLQDGFPQRDHKKSFEINLKTTSYFGEQEEFLNLNQSKSEKEQTYKKYKSPSENLLEALLDQHNQYQKQENQDEELNIPPMPTQWKYGSNLHVQASTFYRREKKFFIALSKSASNIKIPAYEVLENVDPDPPWYHLSPFIPITTPSL